VALYLDTSCLLKTLFVEPETTRVLELCAAEREVVVSTLARLEAVVQIGARVAGGTLSPRAASSLRRRLDTLLKMAPFVLVASPPTAMDLAEQQIRFERRAVHCRTLDRLHIGTMVALGVDNLLTHDTTQARAAAAIGLRVVTP
jgi:predicted nucleic acid-binding protein